MRNRLTAVLAVSLSAVCDADAQRLTDAVVGTRVRLDTTDGALVTGTVVSVDPDSVRVSTHAIGTILSLPLSRVVSYELSLGRNRSRGAERGAAVGGALGLALIVSSLRGDTVSVNGQRHDRRLAIPIAIGLTAVGAAIGAAIAPERWEPPARLHARLSVNACRLECLDFGALSLSLAMRRRSSGLRARPPDAERRWQPPSRRSILCLRL